MQGIYKFEFSDGSVYIGQSENIVSRWSSHISMMVRGEHHNVQVQDRFNIQSFPKFSVLELVPGTKALLVSKENEHIRKAYRNKLVILNSAHYRRLPYKATECVEKSSDDFDETIYAMCVEIDALKSKLAGLDKFLESKEELFLWAAKTMRREAKERV